jgi:SAM-dependent methyltransferase
MPPANPLPGAAASRATASRSLFKCRGCGSSDGTVLIELGELPLANAFVKAADDDADRFTKDLTLVMCSECLLIQIRDEVPREQLFSTFLWVTGTSRDAAVHARWLAARLRERHLTPERRFLVEVASNDGFFLRHYQEAGFDILGVDPADVTAEAVKQGLPTIRDFFGESVAARIVAERGQADVIVARNVLGHSSELRDLVRGMKRLLAPTGVLVLEMPYAHFLRAELQYDTIFHEHLSYLTVGSTARLIASVDMKITDVSFVRMNGGSLLCEVAHADAPVARNDSSLIDFEEITGLNHPSGWMRFADQVGEQRAAFVGMLGELRAAGKRVVAYGAAAKCMTMLNYCRVSTDLISAIGDANPRKQGLLCPGVRIPVVSPERLLEGAPDVVVIGAWNFTDEIITSLRGRGYAGRFLVPLPMPRLID